jgi:hypothetical protein
MVSRIVRIGLIGVAVFWACSQPTESSPPRQLSVSSTNCVTDLSCPFGQECVDGACAPIQPSLYPHIQTASVLMRSPFEGEETAWCATHYDLMIAGARPDEIRALNPNARFFEYTLTRYHAFDQGLKTAFAWALTHGYDPEDFYLHYREDVFVPTWEGRVIVTGFAPGMVPGWNPGGGGNPASATMRAQSRVIGYYAGSPEPSYLANVAHPGFRQFFAERAAALIDGTWYFNTPFSTGPIDGIMCDEAIYYPNFGEGLLDRSTEYYGVPLTEGHPLAVALEELYPFLAEQLMGAIGTTVDVMPNYGHVLFLNYPNQAAMNIQATTPWILGEVWVSFTGSATPTGGSNRCITYDKDYMQGVRKIVEQTRAGGRRLLGARDTVFGPAGTAQGKIFTLALYYLVHNEHTYYVYESARHPYPTHASTWAWNPAAEFDVGQPYFIPAGAVDFEGQANTTEHWVFASGSDPYLPSLTYRVLARRFTNALVLVKMLPLGSVVDSRSTTTHALNGSYRILQADGSLGLTVTEARLRNNEALILIPDAMTGVN